MDRYADPSLLTDQMLFALSNSRRRIFVRYLFEHSPAELKAVAEVIATIEHSSQKSAYTSLYQKHTDKLIDAQIIKQENGQRTFGKGEQYSVAWQILDCADSV